MFILKLDKYQVIVFCWIKFPEVRDKQYGGGRTLLY